MEGVNVIAQEIANLGCRTIFTVPGVPVTKCLVDLQALFGVTVVGCRSEQNATNSAALYGYLAAPYLYAPLPQLSALSPALACTETALKLRGLGQPGVCISTSGPAFINALSGVATAQANHWPLLLIASLGPETGAVKPDVAWMSSFMQYPLTSIAENLQKEGIVKNVTVIAEDSQPSDVRKQLTHAYESTLLPVPSVAVVFIGWCHWNVTTTFSPPTSTGNELVIPRSFDGVKFEQIVFPLLKESTKPLAIFGKGLNYSFGPHCSLELQISEGRIPALTNPAAFPLPILMSPMAKGLIGDSDPRNCAAARSFAMSNSDLVIAFGARLNWVFDWKQEASWLRNKKAVVLILNGTAAPTCLIDFCESNGVQLYTLHMDAASALLHVSEAVLAVEKKNLALNENEQQQIWLKSIADKAEATRERLSSVKDELTCERMMAKKGESEGESDVASFSARRWTGGMSFRHFFEAVNNAAEATAASMGAPIYIVEGATSMDKSRLHLKLTRPGQRVDAATFAAMGVGAPFALAAATFESHFAKLRRDLTRTHPHMLSPSLPVAARPVVLLQGDHAFGFSGFEIETIARYNLNVKFAVLDNGGMYAMNLAERSFQTTAAENDKIEIEDKTATEAETRLQCWSVCDLSPDFDFHKVGEGLQFKFARETTIKTLQADCRELLTTSTGPAILTVRINPLDGAGKGHVLSI